MDNKTTRQEARLAEAQEKFAQELRSSSQAAESAIDSGAEQFAQAGQQIEGAMEAAKEFLQNAGEVIQEQVTAGAKATDEAIRKYPYQAAGIALGVGFLIGYMIKRK